MYNHFHFEKLEKMEADMNLAFAELEAAKESFWNSHNARMVELNSAMESLNQTLEKFDGIDKEQQKISDELDELLSSLE